MKLTEDEKLLYDSCNIYAKSFLLHKEHISFFTSCSGDENVLELCNRCPLYKPEEVENFIEALPD